MKPRKKTKFYRNNTDSIPPAEKFLLDKPSHGRALIPAPIKTITEKTFKTQISKKHYKGNKEVKALRVIGEDEPINLGLVATWQSEEVEHFISLADFAKLKEQAPKVYVSQDKNIKLLLAITEIQQYYKEEKRAEASFTLTEYAKLRGYTIEEIQKGGNFINELKRDLYSGAYTTYRINEITIEGKKYIAHGLPNFYTLLEPKDPRGKWIVKFNPFYADSIIKLLKGEASQYFVHFLKEIADRKTTEKPYLHLFYNQLIYRKQEDGATAPKKVITLLKAMGVNKFHLDRPQACFDILKECLIYIASKYPEELKSVEFLNKNVKQSTKRLPIRNLKDLNDFHYKNFKELLGAIGVKDIREAFIIFFRQNKEKKEQIKPSTQNNFEPRGA